VKHSDSINALAFTYDGSLFASGGDDGLIIVFTGNGHGEEIRRFQMKAPITALVWHTRFGYTIIAGDACGDVHTISLNNSGDVSGKCSCFGAHYIDEISFTEKCILSYF
jgi:WD40 repeat protein